MEGRWGVGCNESDDDPCVIYPDLCNGHGHCVWDDTTDTYYHTRCQCDLGWQISQNCRIAHNPQSCHPSHNTCGDFGTCSYVMGLKNDSSVDSVNPDDYHPVDYICTCDGSEYYSPFAEMQSIFCTYYG